MDENTRDVLKAALDIVSIIVTALMVVYVARSNRKLDTVDKKLDENHKLTNGHMTKLLETTAELATAKEKAKGEAEKKNNP